MRGIQTSLSTGEAPDRSGTASGADGDPAAAPHSDRRGAPVLLVVCTAILLDALDLSITQAALPEIRTSLNLSAAAVQWVVNAYVLTYAGFLPLGGRLADLTGLKRIFLLGMALFGVMSLVGGVAPNATVIILARAAQGVGAALTVPASVA